MESLQESQEERVIETKLTSLLDATQKIGTTFAFTNLQQWKGQDQLSKVTIPIVSNLILKVSLQFLNPLKTQVFKEDLKVSGKIS